MRRKRTFHKELTDNIPESLDRQRSHAPPPSAEKGPYAPSSLDGKGT